MQKKQRLRLFAILFCSLMPSCATVPPDAPAFHELEERIEYDPITNHVFKRPSPECEKAIQEPSCGYGVYMISGKEVFIGNAKGHDLNGKTWDQIKAESVLLPAQESFAPLADYVINSCEQTHCNEQIDRFRVLEGNLHGRHP